MESTDEDLVERSQQGDRAALEELLGRHYDRLFALCRRMAGNDADAADACQEALLAVVRGLGRFDGRASFRTWSHRVATNACLDELRRRGRRPQPTDDVALVGGVIDHQGQAADRLDLEVALGRLSEEFRAPVVLRDVVGLDYAEIAEVLAIPPGTVRSRIARGRRHLASLMDGSSGTDPDGKASGSGNQDRLGERPS